MAYVKTEVRIVGADGNS